MPGNSALKIEILVLNVFLFYSQKNIMLVPTITLLHFLLLVVRLVSLLVDLRRAWNFWKSFFTVHISVVKYYGQKQVGKVRIYFLHVLIMAHFNMNLGKGSWRNTAYRMAPCLLSHNIQDYLFTLAQPLVIWALPHH